MIDRPDWYLRLGYLIHDVSRLRRMMFDRELAPLGITRSQWWVLAFISRKDGLPQTQLANELDVGKVALGALIDRLETSGFVVRQADPVDRRVKRVYLTRAGARISGKAAQGDRQVQRQNRDRHPAKPVGNYLRCSPCHEAQPAGHVGGNDTRRERERRCRKAGKTTQKKARGATSSQQSLTSACETAQVTAARHRHLSLHLVSGRSRPSVSSADD